MSRLKNYSRNLATSYLQLGVNVIYSLVSIPLILHWLSRAEFGLWAVMVQLVGYITLVDLGVNAAVARFLVDHKDRRHEGIYGALIKTSVLVSVFQGLVILTVTMFGAVTLAEWMKVPEDLRSIFVNLIRIQGLIVAFTFCMNPLSIMLNAHQRMDIVSSQSIFSMAAGLGLLCLFLVFGNGIYSFVYANAIIAAIAPCQLFWQCRRLGFLPRANERGRISWGLFKETFFYGKDVFLMGLGAQLITASQTIVISRTLGLDAAAVWAVGTRLFMLVRQVIFQPFNAATSGLYEMAARKEHERLHARFKNLVVLCASLGVYLAVIYAACNSLFVSVWTNGKIIWPALNDVLLGIWIILASVQMPHCNFVLVTKQINHMRYLYFAEGCVFIALSLGVGYRWGIPGIIVCSDICVLLFSCQFGFRRSCAYFKTSFRELVVDWVRPSLRFASVMTPLAVVLWLATIGVPTFWRLAIHGLLLVLVGTPLFLRLGVPAEMLWEVGGRLPRPAARLLEKFVSRTA